jgi:osmotically-inducible protein OsmY
VTEEPVEYRLARLQEALTHDPRVLEQSLEVRVEGDRVILRGELVTQERCQAAIAVAREVFPEAIVVADLTTSAQRRGRSDPERL